ncbi:uncharacterized protein LOC124145164 [Haliotis rufescens]|uniref:uncharacterized protein LOC124145164 n=1 Tax=Haliotis rufescens TaxID=6454 RepID=UPI00201F1047|nr:uncharacterized protein LOC124145164 [Haliotis rufescens]
MDFKCGIILALWTLYHEVSSQAWRISTACYGNVGLNCSFHYFRCAATDHVAVNGAEYLYKDSPRCGTGVGNCDSHQHTCCTPQQEDCSLPYTHADLERLKLCLRHPPCIFKTPWSTHKCVANNHLVQFSSYSVIFYECIKDEHIVNFCDGSITGTSVSIMYDQVRKPVDSDTTCSCRTSGTGQGQTPLFIEALDVHLGNNSSAGCSSLMLNAHDRNSIYDCNSYVIHPSQILISVNGTLPITSQLTVAKNSPPHRVWMRIQAKTPIKVTCRILTNQQPEVQINSSDSTVSKSSLAKNIWIILGGSAGGIVLVAVVCIVSICCIRKHRQKKTADNTKEPHEYFEIEPPGVFSVERTTESSDYYEIRDNEPRPVTDHYYSSADSLERVKHSAHAPNPNVVSGYDHLRLKSGSDAPVAPHYGRLGAVTSEHSYNHLNESRKVVFKSEYDRTSVAV